MAEALEHTYTGVFAFRRDRIFIPAIADDLAEEGEDHALLFRWDGTQWIHWPFDFSVGSVRVLEEPSPLLVAMGVTGEIAFIAAEPWEETVDPSEDGPSDLLHLRAMTCLEDKVFVAGMARRVYRRDDRDAWVAIDEGVFVPREERDEAVGFNAIDGFGPSSLVAAGYKGEIWSYDGEAWMRESSPTNVALNSLRCLPTGETVIVGLSGTVIRGEAGSWRALDQDVTDADFWDLTVFEDAIYVASDEGLFSLEGDELNPVEMELTPIPSTMHVSGTEGALWSVGEKDIVMSEDGQTWSPVEHPG